MLYYLTKRPATLGAIPKGVKTVHNYDDKTYIPTLNIYAWACVEYAEPLPCDLVDSYELTPENAEPNRKALELKVGKMLMKSGIKGREALAQVQAMSYCDLVAFITT